MPSPNRYNLGNLPQTTDPQTRRVFQDLVDRVNYLTGELDRVRENLPELGARKEKPVPGIITIPGLGADGSIRVSADGVIVSYTNPIQSFGDVGTFFNDTVVYSTGANTTETTFTSRTFPANFFARNGDAIIIIIRANDAANGNGKRFRSYFDSTVVFDTTALASQGAHFHIELWFRENNNTLSEIRLHNYLAGAFTAAPNINFQNPVNFGIEHTFSTTGQNSVANAGDITQAGLLMLKCEVPR
jgi:hypothetical protein